MKPSRCKSCGAPIEWARTKAGKSMPVDNDPAPDGTIELVDLPGKPPLAIVHGQPTDEYGEVRYRTHFATCPQANDWRTDPKPPPPPPQQPHRLSIEIDHYGTVATIECPYKADDTTRPCHYGIPTLDEWTADPDDDRCALVGWLEDAGPELHEVFQFDAPLTFAPIEVLIPHGWGDENPTIEQVTP